MPDEGAVEQGLLHVPAPGHFQHSDPHDFAGLYIRHRWSFTLHARRYLRDPRDADEVVQEAFLRLFLALPELETELQALAYCRRTITNLCIDRFRAQARRPLLVDLDSAGALDLAEDDPGDPVVRAEDAALVREALSLLSPLHREALVKREIEEKSLPAIADELHIPEESVKHVLFRARRALRRILAATSLAPGSDGEIPGALGRAARAGSGGFTAFLLLLFLGLGTGPDLRAIPVMGTDLPELIPVGELARAVGGVVTNVADAAGAVVSRRGSDDHTHDAAGTSDAGEPLSAAEPSSSPTAVTIRESDQLVRLSPTTDPATSSPTAVPTVTPSPTETPTASSSPSSSASPSPSASPSESPEPSASSSPKPAPSATAAPTPKASPSPSSSSSEPGPVSGRQLEARSTAQGPR